MSPLQWTCKSISQLTRALVAKSHRVGRTLVRALLHRQKFSLQSNQKTREGTIIPIAMRSFGISTRACVPPCDRSIPRRRSLSAISKNAGREWRPQGRPEEVRVHDFLLKDLGRAVPYGIYDLASNAGWISVGMSRDTSAFAVQTIRRWWQDIGRGRYPRATRLTITADGGGSNGSRVRLWKRELQRLATEIGIDITVHHLPPETSKWNAIEHRLFSFISMNWRAKPLVSYRVIIDLISATTTETGLTVCCQLDSNAYPKGTIVSNREMASLAITRDPFHGDWNYTIHPSPSSNQSD